MYAFSKGDTYILRQTVAIRRRQLDAICHIWNINQINPVKTTEIPEVNTCSTSDNYRQIACD